MSGFYLEKVIINNVAPFDSLELDFAKDGINVLTGLNDSGKTTIISFIVDALVELSKKGFPREYKDTANDYYRIISYIYNLDPIKPAIVYIRFKYDADNIDYLCINGDMEKGSYVQIVKCEKNIEYSIFENELKSIKYCKKCLCDEDKARNIFNNFITPYFPSYRFESPYYLNNLYSKDIKFKDNPNISGFLPNKIEVIKSLEEINNWIFDVALDWIHNRKIDKLPLGNSGKMIEVDLTLEYQMIWSKLCDILTELFKEKAGDKRVRFGIGRRNVPGNRLSILTDDRTNLIAPNIYVLSSGEASVLGIFAEIIKQFDTIKSNTSITEIQGIVLIDEVDKNLHIKLQKEVLPNLMCLFPEVQFILTSHSPFLNMGLADISKKKDNKKEVRVFDLDNKGICVEPENTIEYQNFYNDVLGKNKSYFNKCKSLEVYIQSISKPLVITEGKTDWMHFEKALSWFKQNNEFTDVDICFYKPKDEEKMCDSELYKHLEYSSKHLNGPQKIIGIFDCDEDKNNGAHGKEISREKDGIKIFGNNVFAMSIPVPEFREDITDISVEFLYNDNDLKQKDKEGRRLYTSNEFNERGYLISDNSIICHDNSRISNYYRTKIPKIVDNHIYSFDKSLALSKSDFAENIYDGIFDVSFEGFRGVFERLRMILNSR